MMMMIKNNLNIWFNKIINFIKSIHTNNISIKSLDLQKLDPNFLDWLAGFTDAEGNFSIILKYKSDTDKTITDITGVNFYYGIIIHIDDIETLYSIKNTLNIGKVSEMPKENLCKFSVVNHNELDLLIEIFTIHKLNTTKYLDFLDFKEAYSLYKNRPYNYLYQSIDILSKIIDIKSKMNNSRTNFDVSSYIEYTWDQHIVIRPLWLLGYIEGDGSFNIWRENIDIVFALVQTEKQQLVLTKIKEYLINNLGFCEYSLIKINSSKGIMVKYQKARNMSKATYILLIKDIRIMHNYFIPFLYNLRVYFLTKKLKDFEDIKLASDAIYNGIHRHANIRDLLIRLSYNTNLYRLTSFPTSQLNKNIVYTPLSNNERDLINNYILNKPLTKHLWDGRTINLETNKIIFNNESSIYKILLLSNEIVYVNTLTECAEIIGINIKTLSKYLDIREVIKEEYTAEIKNFKVKRIGVYYINTHNNN